MSSRKHPVRFVKLSPTAQVPAYATKGSAGLDLHADKDMTIAPGAWALVPTGIAIELPRGLRSADSPALRSRLQIRRHRSQFAGHDRLQTTAARLECCFSIQEPRRLRFT
jgi:dUTPase